MSIFDDDNVRDKELEESILIAKFLKEFQEKFVKEIDKEIMKTLYELEHDNNKI